MHKPLSILAQGMAYTAFAAVVGYLSRSPAYVHFDPQLALIKMSFSHAGKPIGACRRLAPEEIAKLAPNMRAPLDCPRERVPLQIELALDGKPLYSGVLPPTGLWNDGPAKVYQRFAVAPGHHHLAARLRDSSRTEGFDYEGAAGIELKPQQNVVVEFKADAGGFTFR